MGCPSRRSGAASLDAESTSAADVERGGGGIPGGPRGRGRRRAAEARSSARAAPLSMMRTRVPQSHRRGVIQARRRLKSLSELACVESPAFRSRRRGLHRAPAYLSPVNRPVVDVRMLAETANATIRRHRSLFGALLAKLLDAPANRVCGRAGPALGLSTWINRCFRLTSRGPAPRNSTQPAVMAARPRARIVCGRPVQA